MQYLCPPSYVEILVIVSGECNPSFALLHCLLQIHSVATDCAFGRCSVDKTLSCAPENRSNSPFHSNRTHISVGIEQLFPRGGRPR